MRKFTFLLTMLLCVATGAMAQTFTVSPAPTGGAFSESTVWYRIMNGKYWFLDVASGVDAADYLQDSATTAAYNDDNALWCVVGNETSGYQFYNKAKGTGYVMGTSGEEDDARTKMYAVGTAPTGVATTYYRHDSGNTNAGDWDCFRIENSGDNYLNDREGYLALWNDAQAYGNDKGSAFAFIPATNDGPLLGNYYETNLPSLTANFSRTNGDRYINDVNLTGNEAISVGGKKMYNASLAWGNGFTITTSAEVTPSFNWTGSWMHYYVYIDRGNDGIFNVSINDDYSLSDDTDIASFNYYGYQEYASPAVEEGVNSIGETGIRQGKGPLPAFTAPATSGFYRMRYKVDWNDVLPASGSAGFSTNAGQYVDVRLHVHGTTSNLSAVTERCAIVSNGSDALSSAVNWNETHTIKITPDANSDLASMKIRYGYNLDNDDATPFLDDMAYWQEVTISETDLTDNGDGSYTYEIPADYTKYDVKVYAVYAESDIPSRTVSVSASDPTMGSAYIGTVGTTTVTEAGLIRLTAVAKLGYSFEGWTLNGATVSTEAEYIDIVEGDKDYVAQFIVNLSGINKPKVDNSSSPNANVRRQAKGEILNANGVYDGSKLVFNPEGNTKYQAWSNVDSLVNVQPGATFDLKVFYGGVGWNDLTVFMIRDNSAAEKLYGPYEGSWSTGGKNSNLFESIYDSGDATDVEKIVLDENDNYVSGGSATFHINMPEDLEEGDVVVIRFLIHGNADEGAFATNTAERNFCDYMFYVPATYEVKMNGVNQLEDGNSAIATFSADKNFILPTGVKAYYAADSGDDGYISLTETTGVVPANEGFMLTAPAAGTKTITTTINDAASITGNVLKPTTGEAIGTDVNAYILNAKDGYPMFYLLGENRAVAKNKAYLEDDGTSSVIKMNFGGEATGIENVETVVETNVNAPIYDLSGRRVMNAVKGGIYIQNGKKFIVR